MSVRFHSSSKIDLVYKYRGRTMPVYEDLLLLGLANGAEGSGRSRDGREGERA